MPKKDDDPFYILKSGMPAKLSPATLEKHKKREAAKKIMTEMGFKKPSKYYAKGGKIYTGRDC